MTRNSNKPWFVKKAVSCDWRWTLLSQYPDGSSRNTWTLMIDRVSRQQFRERVRLRHRVERPLINVESQGAVLFADIYKWAGISEVDLTASPQMSGLGIHPRYARNLSCTESLPTDIATPLLPCPLLPPGWRRGWHCQPVEPYYGSRSPELAHRSCGPSTS